MSVENTKYVEAKTSKQGMHKRKDIYEDIDQVDGGNLLDPISFQPIWLSHKHLLSPLKRKCIHMMYQYERLDNTRQGSRKKEARSEGYDYDSISITEQEKHHAGADLEVEEEGGTHRVGLVRPCGARSFLLRAYNAQCCRKIKNLDHMRVLLIRPSETTITTQNLWQLDCNLGDSSYGRFSEPLPFGISLCI